MQIRVFTDGGSRGNPGHSGYGLVVYGSNQEILFQDSKYLGFKTNNEAEYSGCLNALKWISQNREKINISKIDFCADSQLMICQLKGEYKVKSPNLIPLFNQAKDLIKSISVPINFIHIPRELNQFADTLANQAMDRKS